MKFENALCNIEPNLESSPAKLSTNVKFCNNCKKKRHFSRCCPNFDSKVDSFLRICSHLLKRSFKENLIFCAVFFQQNIDSRDSDSELFNNCESLFIEVAEDEENSSSENEWTIDVLVNKTLVSFKIDSGAQVNIILENCFRNLKSKPKLLKPNAKLTAYNGSNVPVKGSCILNIDFKRKTIPVLFIVADVNSRPVQGLKANN